MDEEEFKQVPMTKMKGGADKFRLNISAEELSPDALPVDYNVPGEKDEEPMVAARASTPPPPLSLRGISKWRWRSWSRFR